MQPPDLPKHFPSPEVTDPDPRTPCRAALRVSPPQVTSCKDPPGPQTSHDHQDPSAAQVKPTPRHLAQTPSSGQGSCLPAVVPAAS